MSNTETASAAANPRKTPRTRRARTVLFVGLSLVLVPTAALAVFGWPASQHATETAHLGVSSSAQAMEALIDQPGPITVETVVGADWEVDRSGLINLKNPRARAAGLTDGPEPIQIYFHALRHPTRGLFLIDTGVQRAAFRDPEHAVVHGFVADLAHAERMRPGTDTASWLAAQNEPLSGVFLTHLHLDHVLGMPDVPTNVPLYVGPGETRQREAMSLFMQPVIDHALEGHGALREWAFAPDPSGTFEGVIDVFGDGSLWAIRAPGHTPGSTAYLARTPRGGVLFTGDVCHTAWGWRNGVEPGTFSHDGARGAENLARLRALVARHPTLDVRLGHQSLGAPAPDSAR